MAAASPPLIQLYLKPHFFGGEATLIDATLTLPYEAVSAKRGPILLYHLNSDNVPCYVHTERRVKGTDKIGTVPFIFVEVDKNTQDWRPGRDIVGDLKLELQVFPRKVNTSTPVGPRVDIRTDCGGLVGTGIYFLPIIAKRGFYNFAVEWDLSLAPPGTRAVWSHGEGPKRQHHVGDQDLLRNSTYMVGPIKSHPPDPQPDAPATFCATYWLSDMPDYLQELTTFNPALFKQVAATFGVPESTYRVFIRRALHGWGGTSTSDSMMFEYDPLSGPRNPHKIRQSFAQKMVHSLAKITFESEEFEWYTKGISELLSIVLPYRAGIVDADYVVNCINGKLSLYYRSPYIHTPLSKTFKSAYSDWYSSALPFSRGFMYMLLLDHRLRAMAGVHGIMNQSPLEQIVIELSRGVGKGKPFGLEGWYSAINKWGGHQIDYKQEWEDVSDGATIDLSGVWLFSPANMPVVQEQCLLDYGLTIGNRNNQRMVTSVVPGSQAQMATVRFGEKVICNQTGYICAENPNLAFWVVIERKGEPMRLEWLPNGNTRVGVWQLMSLKE